MNVLGSTRVLGVFGHPISHSLSPVMQNAAIRAMNIDYVYVPFHVMPEDLAKAVEGIKALQLAGVNVTIPHKERIIEYLDEVSDYSREIGSVNTVINLNGVLRGDTTDGPGFIRSAETAWGDLNGCRTVILGAGGSAKAIAFALARIGCKIVVANRTYRRAVELVESLKATFANGDFESIELKKELLASRLENADLLVNTTSVGMFPDVYGIPLSPDLLHSKLMVYDLVYNPMKTRLVDEAQRRGARAMTGLGMLVHQGALSLRMWTGLEPPIDVMERAVLEHFEKTRT